MNRDTTRRGFLKDAAFGGAGILVTAGLARGAEPAKKKRAPSDKLNIGIVGVGGRGRANTNGVRSENIVALCDVSEKNLAAAAKRFPKAKTYHDWRKMLDQKDIEAVVCSTTEHTHAFVNVWAMKRGMHVYCEKPLAHSVYEARVVRETYLKNKDKVATQMGTQIHAGRNYRRVVELIECGAIGTVREAHVWCGRVGARGSYPKEGKPAPEHLHWDLWLGPAPERPYHPKLMPGNMTWNRYWDYGNGTLGDMGSHLIDLSFWALDLEYPLTAEAHGEPSPASPDLNAVWLIATWEHPAKGKRPPVKLVWYNAQKRPPSPKGVDLSKWGIGVLFIGTRGQLVADYGKLILLPKYEYQDFKPPTMRVKPSLGHYREWIHGCKTGAPTLCNFDYSGKLIENNLLGNVAYRVGKKLIWDPKTLKATNCPEADRFIRRQYRKGWVLEG
jgi:predicted dehydrogenase